MVPGKLLDQANDHVQQGLNLGLGGKLLLNARHYMDCVHREAFAAESRTSIRGEVKRFTLTLKAVTGVGSLSIKRVHGLWGQVADMLMHICCPTWLKLADEQIVRGSHKMEGTPHRSGTSERVKKIERQDLWFRGCMRVQEAELDFDGFDLEGGPLARSYNLKKIESEQLVRRITTK